MKLTSPLRHRRRILAIAVAAAVTMAIAAVGGGLLFGPGTAQAGVSNRGTLVPPTLNDQKVLDARPDFVGEIYLLQSLGGRDFYRVPRTDGTDCWATSSNSAEVRLETWVCSPDFPEQRAVVDFSVFGADKADPELRVVSAQGIAADDVAEIRLVSRTNQRVRSIAVRDNIYSLRAQDLPSSATPVALEAVDRDGNVLFRSGQSSGQRP